MHERHQENKCLNVYESAGHGLRALAQAISFGGPQRDTIRQKIRGISWEEKRGGKKTTDRLHRRRREPERGREKERDMQLSAEAFDKSFCS